MISAAQRDRLFYAKVGKRLAVAPNLFVLGKIGWVDNAIEEAGLLFPLGVQSCAKRPATGPCSRPFASWNLVQQSLYTQTVE